LWSSPIFSIHIRQSKSSAARIQPCSSTNEARSHLTCNPASYLVN
jgi:hypothetical protein